MLCRKQCLDTVYVYICMQAAKHNTSMLQYTTVFLNTAGASNWSNYVPCCLSMFKDLQKK